jgi:hypothetical protein
MTTTKISIIINNYNYESYVGAAIESALAQTYPYVEVVVVDDGSTDGSRAVIESFRDHATLHFQANGGQSAAFNEGLARASGEIVFFLDSDDALHPEAVAEVVARWRPGVAKAQFSLATIDAAGRFAGNVFPNYPPGLASEDVRQELLETALYPCPPTSGNAYARAFLDRVMPLGRWPTGADGPLNTVAPLYGDVVTIDRPLGFYRVHGRNDGAQAKLDPRKFSWYIEHDLRRQAFLREHAGRLGIPIDGEPVERALLHLQYRLASLALEPGRHPVAGETRLRLVPTALRAVLASRERPLSRLVMAGWFLAVGTLPRAASRRLIAWRFVPASRSPGLAKLLRRLRVLRGGGDVQAEYANPVGGFRAPGAGPG